MPVAIYSDQKNAFDILKAGNPAPISETEYRQGYNIFNQHFEYSPGTTVKKDLGLITPILRTDFDTWINSHGYSNDELKRAVVVLYYGFDESTKAQFRGLRLIKHDPIKAPDDYYPLQTHLGVAGKEPTHEFEPNGTTVQLGTNANQKLYRIVPKKSDWPKLLQGYYKLERRLRPFTAPPGPLKQLDPSKDPKAVYFPYKKEIAAVADENVKFLSAGEKLHYVISDYAAFVINGIRGVEVGGPDGYYHSVSFHTGAVDTNDELVEFLNDGASVTLLENKGIDYGHLCPPRCDKARFDK